MGQTIYEKIQSKGEIQVNIILDEAKKQAKQIEKDIVDRAKKDSKNRIDKAQSEAEKTISYKKRLFDLEKRQALLTTKQTIIDGIFDNVLTKLNNLEGKNLLDYVTKLIKNETFIGNETLLTNKKDYDKYLKALSTSKKGKEVDLDLLNKNLNTNFKLSDESVNIENGFILVGEDFDLNFSFNQIISNLRQKNEQAIAKELFE